MLLELAMLETLVWSAAIAIGTIVGVAPPVTPPLAPPGTLPASALVKDAAHPVIVHIVSRGQTVTVKASRGGMLYSLTATDGKVLIADATGQRFAELQPQLFQQIRGAMASSANAGAPIAYGSIAE